LLHLLKTGGLADVAGSLPKALVSMGYDVRIAMPKYQQIDADMRYVTGFSGGYGRKAGNLYSTGRRNQFSKQTVRI